MRPEILFSYFANLDTLSGVGAKTSTLLNKLCGNRYIDLLTHIPTNYIDRRLKLSVKAAGNNMIATLNIKAIKHIKPATLKSPWKVICQDNTGQINIVFFHAFGNYPEKQLPLSEERLISGKIVIDEFGNKSIIQPDYIVSPKDENKIPLIEPIYPLTAGITNKAIMKLVQEILSKIKDLPEWIPENLIKQNNWPTFKEALRIIHLPKNSQDLDNINKALERLSYDEFLSNQLSIKFLHQKNYNSLGCKIEPSDFQLLNTIQNLPFNLTSSQKEVLVDINKDLKSKFRMFRLLQGDVGCGKTIVAILAALSAIEAGYQVAIMAPTDILAKQHKQSLCDLLKNKYNIALLTGKETEANKRKIHDDIKNNKVSIIVGTHALFSEKTDFYNLGLIIIDEQHKFGVKQRTALAMKNPKCNILLMSATPIPRTLALTSYGDLNISKIEKAPDNRQEVKTCIIQNNRFKDIVEAINRAIKQDNKIYWVCPLIEESEKLDLENIQHRYDELNSYFPNNVVIVHGKMSNEEKEGNLALFKEGKKSILLSTTVIEVGVNDPNATIMIIENSERFGLAQLHQLRGRIGRGNKAATCLLMYSANLTEIAKERLKIMRSTTDGFLIAEKDLELRGAGEILGERQSGIECFKISDPFKNPTLLSLANNQALTLIKNLQEQNKSLQNIDDNIKNLICLFSQSNLFD
ncbi:MAG: ATP-dependent DNA helicase RecG [Alphaproteobacteria bacterium]|nr:ATP-dependent DNA helicase RecG [Alphaproteobacteria bacterium]